MSKSKTKTQKHHSNQPFSIGQVAIAHENLQDFNLYEADLNEHFYCLGRSGTGKSNLLTELAIAEIELGHGLCFIDPIGSTAKTLLTHIPTHRGTARSDEQIPCRDKDVIYIDCADSKFPIGINPLYNIAPEDRPRAVSDILQMFSGIWHDSGWGPRMESIFRAALHTLIENPHCMRPSLLSVFRLLLDEEFRKRAKSDISNKQLLDWWNFRFDRHDLHERTRREWVEPVLNKIDALSLDPIIRNIIGQPRCSLDFEEIIRRRQVLIVNLNQNEIGLDNASFIGMLIISRIRQAAAKVGKRDKPFSITIDEAHAFPTMELAKIITQGRHSWLFARIAHQHIDQFDPKISSVLRNGCGSLAIFALGSKDAETIVDDLEALHRDRSLNVIRSLGMGEAMLRLTRDGKPTAPPTTPILIAKRDHGKTNPKSALHFTRERFGTPSLNAEYQIASANGDLTQEEHLLWQARFTVDKKARAQTNRHNRIARLKRKTARLKNKPKPQSLGDLILSTKTAS